MESKVNVRAGLKVIQNIGNSLYQSVKARVAYTVELLVVYHRALFLDHLLIYINDYFMSSSKLTPIMFPHDTFISDHNMKILFKQ